jgi:hypothetical protein
LASPSVNDKDLDRIPSYKSLQFYARGTKGS